MDWQAYDFLDFGIMILDEEMNIAYVNPWIKIRLKLFNEVIIGLPVAEKFPVYKKVNVKLGIRATFKFKSTQFFEHSVVPWTIEIPATPPYNQYFPEMRQDTKITYMENNGLKYCLITITDVSKLAMLETQSQAPKDSLTS